MVYWKIDEETIRCLLNKDEISKMGFDLNEINKDNALMEEFLDAIVQDSHNYIDWNTKNGIQNYVTRVLPADQFLITISCTFLDDAINKDLDQIERMTRALNSKITPERIERIRSLNGEEKEKEFEELSKDLQYVCNGKAAKDLEEAEKNFGNDNALQSLQQKTKEIPSRFPSQKISFDDMNRLLSFASLIGSPYLFDSQLYQWKDQYILLVDFEKCNDISAAISFIITAEEYGGVCQEQQLEASFLEEHARLMIAEQALTVLKSLSE